MVRNIITCIFVSLGITTSYAQQKEWLDPNVNEINRAPMHTNYFAYESEEAALAGCRLSSDNYMTLNGTWKFNWVEHADQRPTDFYKVDFNDKGWDNFKIPAVWELNGYGVPLYSSGGFAWENQFENNPPYVPIVNNHVGTYRKEIEIPSDWKGREIFAHFGSVTSNMYLWVNGKFVGYSEDSKLEAEFDLTKYLHPGKNIVAFQVFRWCDGSYLEDQDFFRYSGVSRDCYLYTRKTKHIQDIRITPDLDAQYKNGILNIALELKGQGTVDLKLLNKSGDEVATAKVKGSGSQKVTMNVNNPSKWTAETPNLYTLLANFTDQGKLTESIPVKVGFRKVEIKNSQVLVNGQPILIKGVNRHEMDPDFGYYISEDRMIQDLKIMKQLNINAVRTCHYPDNNLWYELCDKYGIYLVAEANLESHGMGYGEKTLAKNPLFAKAHLERNKRNIQRSFNHPSVIIWSLGNEAGFGPNFEACYKWIKHEDPSRPVQYEQAETNNFTDIYCPMYENYEQCENYCKGAIQKPLIQCEYAHAMGNSQGGFKEYWDLIRKYPKYQGGFIWDFVDQSARWHKDGKEIYGYAGDFNRYDPFSSANFLDNGLISPDRILNPHAHEVGYIYQNIWIKPVNLERGEISIYNEYFFKNLSNYYAEWKLLANGDIVQTGIINDLKVSPQKTVNQKLNYSLEKICNCNEILLNVSFKLKNAETLLPAGFTEAQQQLVIRKYKAPQNLLTEKNISNNYTSTPIIQENDKNYLIIKGENFHIDFNRQNGFMSLYEVNGLSILHDGAQLTPNFWRAPTDNDMGVNLQKKYKVWKNPKMKLTSLKQKTENDIITIIAIYDMPDVSAKLDLTYRIDKYGAVEITQNMTTDKNANISNLFRFGMRTELNKELVNIQYYGRGPIENYSDRNNSTNIGKYVQTVDEQFYSYIRPQETGTKTDIRWWNQTNKGGYGIQVIGESPFSASALKYTIESLDGGLTKGQAHSELIPQTDYVNFCIDKVQMGLGCVTSWRTLPLDKYLLPYKDYKFKFVIKPIQHVLW